MDNKGLNTKQLGNLFGVDESTVRRWALSGKLSVAHLQVVIENFHTKILSNFLMSRALN